ncbi:hypothetical protein DASC09_039680 [Saccharomycopsis crataegensis]|uniref:PA14 domain-containing protein n=1 Tax=Saccharomycopsis crataegensis TaxID=43959 RepID=A0AAV5QR68_9ASCO|nr:hypothetical protein DASC09_039680 [Saccharomycopsis crataegensis]
MRYDLYLCILVVQFFFQVIHAQSGDSSNNGAIHESSGCAFTSSATGNGFLARFYNYTLGAAYSKTYLESGYATYGKSLGSVSGVTSVNFQYSGLTNGPLTRTIYGKSITVTNFTLMLTGYFYASESGYYKFSLTNSDDAALFYAASASAFDCCGSTSLSSSANLDDVSIYTYYTGPNGYRQIYLEKGYFYPVRLAYLNMQGNLNLNFGVTYPSGAYVNSFSGIVYQFDTSSTVLTHQHQLL